MNKNENNWFYRNRTFLFGFTAVLIVLYIVISLLIPHQTPVAWSGEATEYAVNDEAFAEVHTVALEGTLTSSVIGGTRFDGTLTISGYDELDGMTLHLERKNKRWQGNFNTAAGQPVTTVVHEIYGTKDFENLILDLWTSVEEADDGRMHYEFDLPAAHVLALGADSRQAALRRYQSHVDFAQK